MSDELVLGTLLPLLFLVIGIALDIAATRRIVLMRVFLAGAVRTTGEVVALTEEPPTESGEHPTYRPTVSFLIGPSRRVQFTSMAHSNPPEFPVGATVPVIYDPERPQDARIQSFTGLWLLPTVLGGLGSIFTVLGVALLLGYLVP